MKNLIIKIFILIILLIPIACSKSGGGSNPPDPSVNGNWLFTSTIRDATCPGTLDIVTSMAGTRWSGVFNITCPDEGSSECTMELVMSLSGMISSSTTTAPLPITVSGNTLTVEDRISASLSGDCGGTEFWNRGTITLSANPVTCEGEAEGGYNMPDGCVPEFSDCSFTTDITCEIAIPCTNHGNCTINHICQNGFCVPGEPECGGAVSCPDGFTCVLGVCTPRDECSEFILCPDGQDCVDGACVPEEPECSDTVLCPAGQICEDGSCIAGCNIESPCPEGLRCVEGACVAGEETGCEEILCAAGETCVEGSCISTEAILVPDENLRAKIQQKLVADGHEPAITISSLGLLTQLNASNAGITSLQGLEYAENLTSLSVNGNDIQYASTFYIRELNHLMILNISDNPSLSSLLYLSNLEKICMLSAQNTDLRVALPLQVMLTSGGSFGDEDNCPLAGGGRRLRFVDVRENPRIDWSSGTNSNALRILEDADVHVYHD